MMRRMFLLGAVAYPILELIYRRRTHYSMAIAGGISMLLIDKIRKIKCIPSLKAFVCGMGITGIEYICGLIWNRRHQVWDYRHVPLNYKGQICVPYTLLWCGLGAIIMSLMNKFDHRKSGQ